VYAWYNTPSERKIEREKVRASELGEGFIEYVCLCLCVCLCQCVFTKHTRGEGDRDRDRDRDRDGDRERESERLVGRHRKGVCGREQETGGDYQREKKVKSMKVRTIIDSTFFFYTCKQCDAPTFLISENFFRETVV